MPLPSLPFLLNRQMDTAKSGRAARRCVGRACGAVCVWGWTRVSAFGCRDAARHKYFGGEVVGVSVEVYSGGEGAQRVVLACSFGVFEEVAVKYLCTQEVPAIFGCIEQVAGDDYLVEEVPRTLVGERSSAMVEYGPEWAEELVVFGDVFFVAFGTKDFGAGFVHGVIVEVAHYDYADLWVNAPQRVGDGEAQACGSFAIGRGFFLASDARRPVVDDDGHALSHQSSDDAHLVTCSKGYFGEGVVGDVFQFEVFGVV